MKTATTNRTKTFCKTNVYFRNYVELYHKRRSSKQMPNSQCNYNEHFCNTLYARAANEFNRSFKGIPNERRFGISDSFYSKVQINLGYATWAEFAEFSYSCNMNEKGEWWIYVNSGRLIDFSGGCHSRTDGRMLFTDDESPFERKIQYHGVLSLEQVGNFVIKYIERTLLYPKGYFRNIQIHKFCSKEKAKWYYKIWQERERKSILDDYYPDDERIYKWIKKHFNIESDEYIGMDRTIKTVNKYGKLNELTSLAVFDYDYSGDGDIDELEEDFNEYIDSFSKKTLFV